MEKFKLNLEKNYRDQRAEDATRGGFYFIERQCFLLKQSKEVLVQINYC